MGAANSTEEARWLLEGSHGKTRDAKSEVALLEEKSKDKDSNAMWTMNSRAQFMSAMLKMGVPLTTLHMWRKQQEFGHDL